MGNLSTEQMGAVINTIGKVEGWGAGRVTYETRPDGSTTIKGTVDVTGTRIPKEVNCIIKDGETTCN